MIEPELRTRLAEAAPEPDRGGLTRAGRSLHKKGSRPSSVYPPPAGGPEGLNRTAQEIVEAILDDPGAELVRERRPRFGAVLEVWAPDGRGLRYSDDGRFFIGFLEPRGEVRRG